MNKEYWNDYYSKNKVPFDPSPFSKYVMNNIKKCKLLDIGCGNGRDSIFFNKNGCDVTAIDQCAGEINYLNNVYGNNTLRFRCIDIKDINKSIYDVIYCRFILHSIDKKSQNILFTKVKNNLVKGGFFFIECRSDKDELINMCNTHYKRSINLNDLLEELKLYNFIIKYSEQSRGFSKYKKKYHSNGNSKDPELIRVMCVKT